MQETLDDEKKENSGNSKTTSEEKQRLLAERLAEINKALEQNRLEMARIERELADIDKPKIFTWEELQEMKENAEREKLEKFEKEKAEIDLSTAAALKKASKIRIDAQRLPELLKAKQEQEALQIEREAILRDLKIRKIIVDENKALFESALADMAIEENLFSKYKRESLKVSKKDNRYFEIQDEIYKSKNRKETIFSKCKSISATIDEHMKKILKSEKLFKSIFG